MTGTMTCLYGTTAPANRCCLRFSLRMRLRALGHDEYWLQDQLADNPQILGLGDVELITQELHQTSGGYLDLLVKRDDTYFSVEVQLDGVDASHAFRTLEYWTRNRARWPDNKHVAVIVAEQVNTRYGSALDMLATELPIIAIELTAEPRDDNHVALTSRIVAAHPELGVDVDPITGITKVRTAEMWKASATGAGREALEEFERFVDERLGAAAYVDYSTVSHVGVRRGRRIWCRLRPIESGISVNVPDPDGGRVRGSATEAFTTMRDAVAEVGVAMRWHPSAGDGARPVNFHLRPGDLAEGQVDWALRACWEAFEDLEPFVDRYWSSRDDDRPDPNETSGFEPYYSIEYHEVEYSRNAGWTGIDYFASMDDWQTLWSVPDQEWDNLEFARRVLLHVTGREPTKQQQRRFLAGPGRGWELGNPWAKTAAELAGWAHEHGP